LLGARLEIGRTYSRESTSRRLQRCRFNALGAGICRDQHRGRAAGIHTLAFRVNKLIKNERYRITAWIKPQAGANFGIAARDQVAKDNGPNNARAYFDLEDRRILSAHGNGKPGIEQVGAWMTVWMDLLTTDGQYVVNFYVSSGDADSYRGDGRLGIILGGTAAD
jgi:hypothetical protein